MPWDMNPLPKARKSFGDDQFAITFLEQSKCVGRREHRAVDGAADERGNGFGEAAHLENAHVFQIVSFE